MCRHRTPREPQPIRFLDEEPPTPPTPPPPTPPPAGPKPQAAPAPGRRRREWPVGTLSFLAVVGTGLLIRGAGLSAPCGRATMDEEIGRAFAVSGTPRVVVETFNGPIEVARGEAGTVDCLVTRRGSGPDREAAEADMERVDVSIDRQGEMIRVTARRGGGRGPRDSRASVRLRVPEGSPVRLRTDNGPITVAGVDGPVAARSSNGRIDVRGASGPLALTTTNGAIACEASDAVVVAETRNGGIEFRGSLAPGRSTLHTRNGRVALRLPSDQSFRLDAEAGHGTIATDFVPEPGRKSKPRRLVCTVGDDPEVALRVRSHNGSIRVLEDERAQTWDAPAAPRITSYDPRDRRNDWDYDAR